MTFKPPAQAGRHPDQGRRPGATPTRSRKRGASVHACGPAFEPAFFLHPAPSTTTHVANRARKKAGPSRPAGPDRISRGLPRHKSLVPQRTRTCQRRLSSDPAVTRADQPHPPVATQTEHSNPIPAANHSAWRNKANNPGRRPNHGIERSNPIVASKPLTAGKQSQPARSAPPSRRRTFEPIRRSQTTRSAETKPTALVRPSAVSPQAKEPRPPRASPHGRKHGRPQWSYSRKPPPLAPAATTGTAPPPFPPASPGAHPNDDNARANPNSPPAKSVFIEDPRAAVAHRGRIPGRTQPAPFAKRPPTSTHPKFLTSCRQAR